MRGVGLSAVAMVLALIAALPRPLLAQDHFPDELECVVTDDVVSVICHGADAGSGGNEEVSSPEAPASPASPGSSSGASGGGEAVERPATYWTRALRPEGISGGDVTGPCAVPGTGEPGRTYVYTLWDRATGEPREITTTCAAVAEAGPDAPDSPGDPAPIPAPPTLEEILDRTPIPQAQIVASPSARGLTGLESWFWAVDPGDVDALATIRGWTASGSVSPTNWSWVTGDGGTYTSSGPGSAEDPAVRHTYETTDVWPVRLQVSWSGSWTISGYGTEFTMSDLSTDTAGTLDYLVIEVRGVLDEPKAN